MTFEVLKFLNSGCLISVNPGSDHPSSDLFQLGWGQSKRVSSLQSLHQSESSEDWEMSVYAPDFFLQDLKPHWIFPFSAVLSRNELVEILSDWLETQEGPHPEPNWIPPDRESFHSAFDDLKHLFQSGVLKKAVPVVFEKARLDLNQGQKASLLHQLLMNTRRVPVYVYGLWDSQEGILGATPEFLLNRVQGSRVFQSMALAGTRVQGIEHSFRLPLLEDPKELEEHRIVIEGICDAFRDYGTVEVGVTRELHLAHLTHLMTVVSLISNVDFPLETLIRRLHPTPALGAFPRDSGLQWLNARQVHGDRFRFGAPLCFFPRQSHEDRGFLCLVSIRNLQWKDSNLMLGAGCGVISASDFDREWQELLGKVRAIKKSFGWGPA